MPELKALLFDVDGTLADTEEAHRQAFNWMFQQSGLDWYWSPELYLELLKVTGGKERILHYVMRQGKPWPPHVTDPKRFVSELHVGKTARYLSLLKQGNIPLRPGVERLLREARARGVALAITTTTSLPNVHTLLQVALGEEATSWFATMVTGEDVEHKKPDPQVYLKALQRLNLRAANCIALEDSDNGLKAARAAGLTTVITVNPFTALQRFPGACVVLESFGEPEQPARVISGELLPRTYVDLDGLHDLLQKAQQ